MNTRTNVLLLIGSPKAKSTSASLGNYLLGLLRQSCLSTGTLHIGSTLRSPDGIRTMHEAVDGADIIVLAFPLYVDSLPGPLVSALESLARHRRGRDCPSRQRLLAIANCGFPESCHNDTALAQVRLFCRDAGFEWVGGLGLGGGGMINGLPLEKRGLAVHDVIASLRLAAHALAAGSALPDEAISLMARKRIPSWLYTFIGNTGWKREAKKFGALEKLHDRPYQDGARP